MAHYSRQFALKRVELSARFRCRIATSARMKSGSQNLNLPYKTVLRLGNPVPGSCLPCDKTAARRSSTERRRQ
jgi:hypothetical protein